MVKVIHSEWSHADYGGGDPLIHIHHLQRQVHGNGVAVKVYGELRIAAKEAVFAYELGLKTIQELQLTPEAPAAGPAFTAQKWIYHKGAYDNYASIEVFTHDPSDNSVEQATAGHADMPYDGSIWLNFEALGE